MRHQKSLTTQPHAQAPKLNLGKASLGVPPTGSITGLGSLSLGLAEPRTLGLGEVGKSMTPIPPVGHPASRSPDRPKDDLGFLLSNLRRACRENNVGGLGEIFDVCSESLSDPETVSVFCGILRTSALEKIEGEKALNPEVELRWILQLGGYRAIVEIAAKVLTKLNNVTQEENSASILSLLREKIVAGDENAQATLVGIFKAEFEKRGAGKYKKSAEIFIKFLRQEPRQSQLLDAMVLATVSYADTESKRLAGFGREARTPLDQIGCADVVAAAMFEDIVSAFDGVKNRILNRNFDSFSSADIENAKMLASFLLRAATLLSLDGDTTIDGRAPADLKREAVWVFLAFMEVDLSIAITHFENLKESVSDDITEDEAVQVAYRLVLAAIRWQGVAASVDTMGSLCEVLKLSTLSDTWRNALLREPQRSLLASNPQARAAMLESPHAAFQYAALTFGPPSKIASFIANPNTSYSDRLRLVGILRTRMDSIVDPSVIEECHSSIELLTTTLSHEQDPRNAVLLINSSQILASHLAHNAAKISPDAISRIRAFRDRTIDKTGPRSAMERQINFAIINIIQTAETQWRFNPSLR